MARGQKISELQKAWARILYQRGKTLLEIEKTTGISESALSNFKRADKWEEDRDPLFTNTDLLENTRSLFFRYQIQCLIGVEDDPTRMALNLAKFTTSIKDMEDLVDTVSARDGVLTMREFMAWLVDHPELSAFDAAQQFHDLKADALQI